MIRTFCITLLFAIALTCAAQSITPNNIYAAGISYNAGASPAIAGTGLYARRLADGTFAFTAIDALPITVRPFIVTTNVSLGIGQKVLTIGKVPIYVPTSAGISWSGTHTGWAWSTGGLAWIKIRGNWAIAPHVRVLKSSVSNGSGYGVIAGVLVGWGQ